MLIRRALLAIALAFGALAPAIAAAPPPVPALPDTTRLTTYTPSASTGPFSVGFDIYGDGTDYGQWVEVWLNGVRLTPVTDWQLTSATGGLAVIPRPITNGAVTLTTAATGTLQIVGARRPRRTATFAENRGVPARDFNQVLNDIVAMNRETWDKINDVTGRGLFGLPGEAIKTMPSAVERAGKFMYWDATGLIPLVSAGGAGSGNVAGPASSVAGHLAIWDNATGTLLADSGLIPPVSVLKYGVATCAGSTDASAAVAAALAAGNYKVFLPAGCYYQPPTVTGNEVTPQGLQLIGQNSDPNLYGGKISLIRTANRAGSTDGLYLGAQSSVQNVAVQSYFCDQSTHPQGTQKYCPIGYASNIGSQAAGLTNWPYQSYFLVNSASSIQPGPITSTDTVMMGLVQANSGDGIFSATTANGVSHRIWTSGIGDYGILMQNATANPASIHYGYRCEESGTNTTNGGCVQQVRNTGSTTPLQTMQDNGPATATSSWFQQVVSYQSAGIINAIFQTITPFSGDFNYINAGNGGGTFNGNFVKYTNNGVSSFEVRYDGNTLGGTYNKVTITPPASGSTLTIANGKTLTVNNSIGLTGTDGTTMTFPNVSANITRTVASGAKALATGAISSAACTSAQTDTATGTLTTDVVTASFNGDPTAVTGYVPLTTGMLTIMVYPTADTVNFKVCNNTGSSITPGAITLNWRVVR